MPGLFSGVGSTVKQPNLFQGVSAMSRPAPQVAPKQLTTPQGLLAAQTQNPSMRTPRPSVSPGQLSISPFQQSIADQTPKLAELDSFAQAFIGRLQARRIPPCDWQPLLQKAAAIHPEVAASLGPLLKDAGGWADILKLVPAAGKAIGRGADKIGPAIGRMVGKTAPIMAEVVPEAAPALAKGVGEKAIRIPWANIIGNNAKQAPTVAEAAAARAAKAVRTPRAPWVGAGGETVPQAPTVAEALAAKAAPAAAQAASAAAGAAPAASQAAQAASQAAPAAAGRLAQLWNGVNRTGQIGGDILRGAIDGGLGGTGVSLGQQLAAYGGIGAGSTGAEPLIGAALGGLYGAARNIPKIGPLLSRLEHPTSALGQNIGRVAKPLMFAGSVGGTAEMARRSAQKFIDKQTEQGLARKAKEWNVDPTAVGEAMGGNTEPLQNQVMDNIAKQRGVDPAVLKEMVGGNPEPLIRQTLASKGVTSPENQDFVLSFINGEQKLPFDLTPDQLVSHIKSIQQGNYLGPISDIASRWWQSLPQDKKIALVAGGVGLGLGAVGQLTGVTPGWANALAGGAGAAGLGYAGGLFDNLLPARGGQNAAEPQPLPIGNLLESQQGNVPSLPANMDPASMQAALAEMTKSRNEWEAQRNQGQPPVYGPQPAVPAVQGR